MVVLGATIFPQVAKDKDHQNRVNVMMTQDLRPTKLCFKY